MDFISMLIFYKRAGKIYKSFRMKAITSVHKDFFNLLDLLATLLTVAHLFVNIHYYKEYDVIPRWHPSKLSLKLDQSCRYSQPLTLHILRLLILLRMHNNVDCWLWRYQSNKRNRNMHSSIN